ncbi:hypothetical protein KY289_011169 [Solanum tuberosum]|nr:hypothetical protein KY289_011169 [Solanum tuberosum]
MKLIVGCSRTLSLTGQGILMIAHRPLLTHLLQQLQFPLTVVLRVLCDNISTTYIYANPVFHSHMKHVDIDFNFFREQVERKQLEVAHLHVVDQVADLLTKPLLRTLFGNHFSKLGVVNLDANLRGSNNG